MNKGLPSVLLLAALAACSKSEAPVVSKPAAASHVAAQTDCEATVVRTSGLSAEFETKFASTDRRQSQVVCVHSSR